MKLSSSYVNLNRSSNRSVALPNVVKIDFQNLRPRPGQLINNDPIRCQSCQAVFNWSSSQDTSWLCKFCHKSNNLKSSDKIPPILNQSMYMIGEASVDFEPQYTTADDKYLMFCIDVSGSMTNTFKIDRSVVFPTDEKRETKKRQDIEEMRRQFLDFYLEAEDPDKKLVSQLEIIQSALCQSLDQISVDFPKKRVGLITFSSKVDVIGDGRGQKIEFSGDQLNNWSELENLSRNIPVFSCIDTIISLEAKGETALGPALYLSILIAGRKPGSRVILCTDGLANQGLGSLVKGENGDIHPDSIQFYNKLAALAQRNGVSVSVITIKDNDSRLGVLENLITTSGGTTLITDPANPQILEQNFSTMSVRQGPVAYNLAINFIVPKELFVLSYVKNYLDPNDRSSTLKNKIGNVTKDMEEFFEFALRDDVQASALNRVPIQVQLEYMGVGGRKLLKVINDEFDSTQNEEIIKQSVDLSIIGFHVIKIKAHLMTKGKRSLEIVAIIDKINQLAQGSNNFSREEFNQMLNMLKEIKTDINRSIAQVFSDPQRRGHIVNENPMQFASDASASALNKVMSENTRRLRK